MSASTYAIGDELMARKAGGAAFKVTVTDVFQVSAEELPVLQSVVPDVAVDDWGMELADESGDTRCFLQEHNTLNLRAA